MKATKLSERERGFCLAYVGPAKGIGQTAAIMAGYSSRGAHVAGVRLLRRVTVQRELARLRAKLDRAAIADAEERDAILTAIARREAGLTSTKEVIAAVKELNKCQGRHSMTHYHKGKTLEEILEESRQNPAPPTT